MKKLIILFIVFTTMLLSGCTKYEEGPKITFRSFYSRITGNWKVIEYSCNDVDLLQYYNDSCGANIGIGIDNASDDRPYIISFTGGKKVFIATATTNDKNNLNIKTGNFDYLYNNYFTGPFLPSRTSSWHILRLTKKELKVSIDFDNSTYKISFKKI